MIPINYSKIVKFLKAKEKIIFNNNIQDFCFLESVAGRNNKNVVIRLFFENNKKIEITFRYNINLFNQYKTALEYKKLKYLKGEFSPAPYYFSYSSKNIFKKNILILEYIDGVSIKPKFFNSDDIEKLAKTLSILHKATFKKYSKNLEFPPSGNGDIKKIFLWKINNLYIFFLRNKIHYRREIINLFNRTKDFLISRVNRGGGKGFSFIHGDLRNHFIKKDNKIYLVDWELSAIGDIADDLAHFLYFSKLKQGDKKFFVEQYLKYSRFDKSTINRINNYIILEEFFGLKWCWEQMKLSQTDNEKYHYHCLYKVRFKNLKEAFPFFSNDNYYLTAGHLNFL